MLSVLGPFSARLSIIPDSVTFHPLIVDLPWWWAGSGVCTKVWGGAGEVHVKEQVVGQALQGGGAGVHPVPRVPSGQIVHH